jgi:hypothetical protein
MIQKVRPHLKIMRSCKPRWELQTPWFASLYRIFFPCWDEMEARCDGDCKGRGRRGTRWKRVAVQDFHTNPCGFDPVARGGGLAPSFLCPHKRHIASLAGWELGWVWRWRVVLVCRSPAEQRGNFTLGHGSCGYNGFVDLATSTASWTTGLVVAD